MARTPSTTWRRLLIGGAALATACATAVLAVPASATPDHPAAQQSSPVSAGTDYLALGDSVSFGFREPANLPTPNYSDAASFVGFPEDIAAELHLHVANASCPGETSGSLINASLPSNGCETDAAGTGPGYRTAYPLHVSYAGSQLHYGVRYLHAHPDTRLVTLMIGANDGFLCETTTSDNCKSEFPTVLANIAHNVSHILQTVRGTGYTGQIVIVNYYSTNYKSASSSALSRALNAAMDAGAQPYDVTIADAYAAFQQAAEQVGGNTCKAGLLTKLTTGGCGVHPSVAGQEVLAGTVERVVNN